RRTALLFRVETSHKRTSPSTLPVARVFPSGEKSAHSTGALCPLRAPISRFARKSQSFTESFQLPEAINVPSGEHLAKPIQAFVFALGKVCNSRCAATSHTLTVRSLLPVTRMLPLSKKAAEKMPPLCPLR